jgi:hypothetical protein
VVVEVVTVGVEAPPDATVVGALAATVVVGDVVAGAAVVVVAGAAGVHTAYRTRPPAGIVMDCPSVYEMPLPALAVSHRERVKPDFVSPLPVPSVTVEPDAPVVTDAVPEPPFAP